MTSYLLSILNDGKPSDEKPIAISGVENADDILLRAAGSALPRLAHTLFNHVVELRLSDTGGLTVASLLLLGTKTLPAV